MTPILIGTVRIAHLVNIFVIVSTSRGHTILFYFGKNKIFYIANHKIEELITIDF